MLSQFSNFPEIFYFFIYLLFFGQIIELNIVKIDTKGDGILKIIKYFENIFLFHKIIKFNNIGYIILLILMLLFYFSSILLSLINKNLYVYQKKKNRFLITTNSILNLLNIYYTNGPAIQILLYRFFCHDETKTYLCPIKNISTVILMAFFIIYIIFIILSVYVETLYINDIGNITGKNVKSKINNNYTSIIVMIKLVYFILYHFIEQFIHENNNIIILIYNIFIMLCNIFISIYTYKQLFYYNNYINALFHYGWKYTTWFSICIFLKNIMRIKDITLFIILGIIIITIALLINNKYRYFLLIIEFNNFEGNDLKNIQIFNHKLLDLLKNNDQKSKILIAGVIKRFEEFLKNNSELCEQYKKLLNDPHLQKKFTSKNELAILSIISITYSYNIEKSKDITDITLNMCYFLIYRFKNPIYAIWLITKLKVCNNVQSYYRYCLIEEIKDYLISKMKKKNTQKIKIRNVEISSAILYNQYINIFKIKIYEATCSQIEYFDILRNKIATNKTVDDYLRVGKDVLSIRKETLNLWDKIILLNPFSYESKNDFLLYIDSVLQDHILAKNEENKFYNLQAKTYPEKDNIYYAIFNQELSSVLLADGYSFNGKIIYMTPNFPYLFLFSEKEIINTLIDDLLPDVIQNLHKYIIEDAIKNSNLSYIFKEQRDSLLKGKSGVIFNINLYVKPVPNLLYGLIYFIYIKKNIENNFIIILDENLMISGFTEINQMGSNFIWSNNYDLNHFINGHHIGLIIPDILLYLNYDIQTNTFSLPKKSIDLKGYLYPTNNFNELDERIPLILEEIKQRKSKDYNNENKIKSMNEFDELIRILNMQEIKPYSIFFRIELHSFIGGKYFYYRIYITSDLSSGNHNILNSEIFSKSITRNNKNIKDYFKHTVMTKIKFKELSEDKKENVNKKEINHEVQNNQENMEKIENNNLKLIKLKNVNKELNKNNNLNKTNINQSINNYMDLISSQNISPLKKTNNEPMIFNKIKTHILKKNDSSQVKKMRYLAYIFIPVNIILILVDFFYTGQLFNKMVEFLKENKLFSNIKISMVCVYSSTLNLKMLKDGYIDNNVCPNKNCSSFFIDILKISLMEIRNQKSNIYLYHNHFQKVFNQKIDIDLYFDNSENINNLTLDMNNFLNIIISHGTKFISIINEYNNKNNLKESDDSFNVYLKNIQKCSVKFINSNYSSFIGKEKDNLSNNVSFHIPFCISIYLVFLIYIIYIYYSHIIVIKDIQIFYFDKLVNFASPNFEIYLKKLDEIKKKFRDETNEEDDKNIDDFGFKDEIEDKNNSKIKTEDKNKYLKKKNQNKIQQQKIKNKRIISDYLFKKNVFLILKFGTIFLLSASYYIASIIINKKMKNNYYAFDLTAEEINNIYFSYFKIFLTFEEQVTILGRTHNILDLNIPKDKELTRLKFGNSLIYIIKSSKYSKDNQVKFEKLYNEDACEIIISDKAEKEICRNLLSSILSKGFEQAIVQISTIITNVIDEFKSLNINDTYIDIYKENSIFLGYDFFMEYYMFKAFKITTNIFEKFKNDEKSVIFKIYKIILIIFCMVYSIIFIFLLLYIYQYKDFTESFLSFIGIIPAKYMADDKEFYKQVIALEPYYS